LTLIDALVVFTWLFACVAVTITKHLAVEAMPRHQYPLAKVIIWCRLAPPWAV